MIRKKLFIVVVFNCFLLAKIFAQQNHFIFIQSDDKQIFYVELNNKLYNSAGNGYLIIPKLVNGDYNFILGFPQEKFPKQNFTCTVNNNDMGFALKNLGEKGWALVNFQTQEVLISGDPMIHKIDSSNSAKKENPFGEMLSDVVDDSTLTKSSGIDISSTVKPLNENANVAANDSSVLNETNNNNSNSTKGIIKASEIENDKGTDLVFVDFNLEGADTIKIFIPVIQIANDNITNVDTKPIGKDTVNTANENISEVKTNNDSAINANHANNAKPNNPFFNSSPQTSTDQNNNDIQKPTEESVIAYKSDCAKMLSDNEFEKLKRKMFTEGNNEKMIQLAQKATEGRCLTTAQVKNLVIFFQSDESRYRFLDIIYNSVYDYSNFTSLENQLVDPYYKKRFLAMLK